MVARITDRRKLQQGPNGVSTTAAAAPNATVITASAASLLLYLYCYYCADLISMLLWHGVLQKNKSYLRSFCFAALSVEFKH